MYIQSWVTMCIEVKAPPFIPDRFFCLWFLALQANSGCTTVDGRALQPGEQPLANMCESTTGTPGERYKQKAHKYQS